MLVSDVSRCLQLVCVTCRLSCLDEELLLLRDREDIFCDMAELRSSEPISLQTLWLEYQDHSYTEKRRGGDRVRRKRGRLERGL